MPARRHPSAWVVARDAQKREEDRQHRIRVRRVMQEAWARAEAYPDSSFGRMFRGKRG